MMFAILARLPTLARRVALGTVVLTVPLDARAQGSDAAALDKLLGPIALYPDPLLAQVLTASTSPEQVKEFNTWLQGQTLKGSELQQAATDEGFEASFASLALFPEVVSTLASNMDWTKEVGTAYLSDAKGVMASVQRLRDQAHDVGNLKTNDQQTVTVENTGGSQTVVIQPTNPQVVYVPSYDPQVVYTQPPPPPPSSGNAVMAGLIGFGIGIAIGAAIDNDPYYYGPHGWGAWGMGWGGGAVVYSRSVWVVPARPRYPYVRPVPGYRPRTNVVAPRRTNVNINVDNSRTNVNIGNKVNTGNRTNVSANDRNRTSTNVSKGAVDRPGASKGGVDRAATSNANRAGASKAASTAGTRSPNAGAAAKTSAATRGHSASSTTARATPKSGSSKTAMSGYSNGSNAKAASSRGKASVSKSKAGGGVHKR